MKVDPAYEGLLTDIYIHNEAELRRVGRDFAIDGTIRFYLERDIVLTQPWTPIGDSAIPATHSRDREAKRYIPVLVGPLILREAAGSG
jgi:hypothetical protein